MRRSRAAMNRTTLLLRVLTAAAYQMVVRRGRQSGVDVLPPGM